MRKGNTWEEKVKHKIQRERQGYLYTPTRVVGDRKQEPIRHRGSGTLNKTKQNRKQPQSALTGHFISYTSLVLGWTPFAFRAVLILQSKDSTYRHRHGAY